MMTDYSLHEFTRLLASDSPAPGGGSVAALSGAFGAALCSMVAALTAGREKYAQYDELSKDIIIKTDHLRLELLTAADADATAFNAVGDAMRMPKRTEEEKALRKASIQSALKHAADVPLGVMELSLRALELTKTAVGKSNTNAVSDLGAAALSLRTALCGAWLNVLINLNSIHDGEFVGRCRSRGEQIMSTALPLADEIYNAVIASIQSPKGAESHA